MGQQQVLFLILGVCIIGIAVSSGIIVLQSGSSTDERHEMMCQLKQLADAAHAYRLRPFEDDGGDGTFLGLTATPQGIARLTDARTTPHAEYAIVKSGNTKSVQILAVGYSPGYDSHKPIKLLLTVYPDSASVATIN
jgi:hypothetical protein